MGESLLLHLRRVWYGCAVSNGRSRRRRMGRSRARPPACPWSERGRWVTDERDSLLSVFPRGLSPRILAAAYQRGGVPKRANWCWIRRSVRKNYKADALPPPSVPLFARRVAPSVARPAFLLPPCHPPRLALQPTYPPHLQRRAPHLLRRHRPPRRRRPPLRRRRPPPRRQPSSRR